VSGETGTAEAASATSLRRPRSAGLRCRGANGANSYVSYRTVLDDFGRPARICRFRGYTIMVWNKNLLGDLGAPR
jgi:hypothetical protein